MSYIFILEDLVMYNAFNSHYIHTLQGSTFKDSVFKNVRIFRNFKNSLRILIIDD